MKITIEFDNEEEALMAIKAPQAWHSMKRIADIIRIQRKHGEPESIELCLEKVSEEVFSVMDLLGDIE